MGNTRTIVHEGESKLLYLWFFNIFIIRQAHLPPKVPKLVNFRWSLEKSQLEIELCSSKHNFTVPLKNVLFLNYYFSKILIFFKCAKNAPNKCFRRSKHNSYLAKRKVKKPIWQLPNYEKNWNPRKWPTLTYIVHVVQQLRPLLT